MARNQSELMQAAVRWLTGQGEDPFASSPYEGSNYSMLLPPPTDEDEFGTLDHARDAANYTQDVNNIISDPAFITQMSVGGGIGGWQPADFEPTITWEPVKAPGYQRIQFLKGSGDPVQEFIAGEMENGSTAYMATTKLKQLFKEGGGDYPELEPLLKQLDANKDGYTGEPDWKPIESMAQDLEKLVINDPQFNAIDPKTQLPANLVDAATGQLREDYRQLEDGTLERRVERPTEAMEYFEEVGLPNPFEEYDPDKLASQSQLMREDRQGTASAGPMNYYQADGSLNELAEAQLGARDASSAITEVMRQFGRDQDRKAGDNDLAMRGMYTKLPETEDSVANSASSWLAAGNKDFVDKRQQERAMARQLAFDRDRGIADNQTRAMGRRNQPRDRGPLADNPDDPRRVAFRKAMNDAAAARNRAGLNFADQRMREQMMRRITAAGHTPFNDRMRARQQNVMGF